jgi:hypothetical protein
MQMDRWLPASTRCAPLNDAWQFGQRVQTSLRDDRHP